MIGESEYCSVWYDSARTWPLQSPLLQLIAASLSSRRELSVGVREKSRQ